MMFAVNVIFGHLSVRDKNYGLRVRCYVCGTPHKASGLARIEDASGHTEVKSLDVPVCEECLRSDRNGVIRKFLNLSDLEILEVGPITEH
jgi:ribosomal protein S14